MERQCRDCIYLKECKPYRKKQGCEDYVPRSEEKYWDNYIERGRRDFYDEWFVYIKEYDSGDLF